MQLVFRLDFGEQNHIRENFLCLSGVPGVWLQRVDISKYISALSPLIPEALPQLCSFQEEEQKS